MILQFLNGFPGDLQVGPGRRQPHLDVVGDALDAVDALRGFLRCIFLEVAVNEPGQVTTPSLTATATSLELIIGSHFNSKITSSRMEVSDLTGLRSW